MVLQLLVNAGEYNSLYENHASMYQGDSGIDLFFPEDVKVPADSTILVNMKVSCEMREINCKFKAADQNFFVNKSYYLYPRSSIYKTPIRLANSVGIIDSGYRGNIKVALDNITSEPYVIKKGSRLFQICAPSLEEIKLVLTDALSPSKRGANGFGSSGI